LIREPKAQIGYVYQDSTGSSYKPRLAETVAAEPVLQAAADRDLEEDLDMALEIDKLTNEHKVILNKCATNYGMDYGDYIRLLIVESEEKEKVKMCKLIEAEKAQYSGRKSRRERRIVKERLRRDRGDMSPLR